MVCTILKKHPYILLLAVFVSHNEVLISQIYYASGQGSLYQVTLPFTECESNGCNYTEIGPVNYFSYSFCPDGNFYGLNTPDNDIYQIDPATGNSNLIFNNPSGLATRGLACSEDSLFYTLSWPELDLYLFNINSGSFTLIGPTNFYQWSYDIAVSEGEYYFSTLDGIVHLDIVNPGNSSLVVSWQPNTYHLIGLTAASFCHTLLGRDINSDQLIYINLIDGTITPICSIPQWLGNIVSNNEYANLNCAIYLDLDCNDSSGATEADYNSFNFDCLSNGVDITDEDIKFLYDALITSMSIEITGLIPDAPFEVLNLIGTVPNINATGSGTSMITLTNSGGAKSTDFKDALRLIRYDNTALLPTAGLRTVEVQFTTESGSMSNVATAFIQVNELPLVEVELGPDQEACDGETATFDAGNAGADYDWSTGETSQTITVDEEGEYIVTVSDGINCPNQDTVALDLLPVIHVSLTGDTEICDNVQANLTINTDATFSIDVEITSDPGSSFTLTDITGNFSFTVLISDNTEYTITKVIPSQPACIEMIDPEQTIDVYPSYIHSVEASICNGDSIWLGSSWETEAGTYTNTFNSIYSCDSVVTTTLNILPAEIIYLSTSTCDSALAGVFYYQLNNPNGCDTLVQTTVTLLNSDTTTIFQTTCVSSQVGVLQDHFTNQHGCDSLVITSINFVVAHDTTFLFQSNCDSSQVGVFQLVLQGNDNCDSIVITQVDFGMPDTNFVQTTSCDSASLGVFIEDFVSSGGCDSTVITTVSYSASDSTFIQSASCNPTETGVFVESHVNRFGCDSIVTTIVSLLQSNETLVQLTTCDPSSAGVFIASLTNQFGCDSIVTTTVELLPSDETYFSSTTCKPSEAGIFITGHQNQYGCDSIITLTVSLVPADTTILANKTCDPAEVGENQTLYTGQQGCDSLVIEQTTLYPPAELNLEASNYNGYAISCFGESDGSILVEIIGTAPFTYMWSTGNTEASISGISAGSYAVTVMDGNGCTTSGEVMLFEPDLFSIGFEISHPDCFDSDNGSITVEQSGGIEPIRYTIDEINYQSSPVFENLSGGIYPITALDANDCEVKEIIWINVPLMVSVELGDDMQLFPGDTVVINAIVNVPFDSLASVEWNGLLNPDCPRCLTQAVAPIITTTYSVSVTTPEGCSDEDALTLFVENDNEVYVPNIFSPNGDGVNDEFVISTKNGVEKITSFIVYDRWGNVLYEKVNALPGEIRWDGTLHHQMINPGVFAYRLILEYGGGQQDVLYGDLTIVR